MKEIKELPKREITYDDNNRIIRIDFLETGKYVTIDHNEDADEQWDIVFWSDGYLYSRYDDGEIYDLHKDINTPIWSKHDE